MGEPTGPVRGNPPEVAAIDVDGNRYCIDCAPHVIEGRNLSYQLDSGEWESTENADGEDIVDRLLSGEIHTLGNGGAVLWNPVDKTEREPWHCGRIGNCEHAVSGDKYEHISHAGIVGVLLEV